MARMYSRKHGKSGSTKPTRNEPPEWADLSENEIESKVVELGEEGKSPSEIGKILRDKYGIPSVKYFGEKKISDILEENDMRSEIPTDLRELIDKAREIRKHLERNPKDSSAIHGLEETESKIRRLRNYYKKQGKIPQDWEYNPEEEFHKRT